MGCAGAGQEVGETWELTFKREMLEETCSVVTQAKLLGFCGSRCLNGEEESLVLVRSVWRGDVDLLPWVPEFEVAHHRLVPIADLLSVNTIDAGWEPMVKQADGRAVEPSFRLRWLGFRSVSSGNSAGYRG